MKQWRQGARVAVMTVAGAMLSIALSGQAAEIAATKQKPAKPDGVAVKVTPEMIGAGIVSSGVALPRDPAGHRHPRPAGGGVGQVAAVSDRHRRPAQQPPDRDCARQAHRVGIPVAESPDLSRQRRRVLLAGRAPADGQRGGQLRHPHHRLRDAADHVDVRRFRHQGQQAGVLQLSRRRTPPGGRHGGHRRHPQLPDPVHRSGNVEDHGAMG